MADKLREQLVRIKVVGSWNSDFRTRIVILLEVMVVLYIVVRLYIILQNLLRCLFSGKMVFDHFPVFALKIGLEICPEVDLKFCLEKIGFFDFLCFCVFMRSFWHRKILRKNNGKIAKVQKINSKLLFSGKMAPENTYEGE